MTDKTLILTALKKYNTTFKNEIPFIQETINFIENTPNCFDRSHLEGHITGSAWLLNSYGTKVLLTHHKKLNRWLQLGGHSDGESNTWNVALKEATEESGIQNIQFISSDIFDVDVHTIPENTKKNEPQHKHYDIRFLLKAPTETFVISHESNLLKWVTSKELLEMSAKKKISPSMERMMKKWEKLRQ